MIGDSISGLLSTMRGLDNTSLDELGEFAFRLIHPHNLSGSTCHSIKAYQDGVEIGTAYYSGVLMPEDD